MNHEYQELYEFQPEIAHEMAYGMNEYELANELLEIQSEGELDQFLGKLVSGAWRGIKSFAASPQGQALKGQMVSGLKSFGRQALPQLGSAIGGYFGGDKGSNIGSQIGNWGANRFLNEYEYEGEYEGEVSGKSVQMSKRFIRVAREASRAIASAIKTGKPVTQRAIRRMILQAANQHMSGGNSQNDTRRSSANFGMGGGGQNQGTWYRQGNRIILNLGDE